MKIVICALVFTLISGVAWAQQKPPDPRLTQPMIAAMQSLLALREAEMRVMVDDHAKEIADLKTKCGDPCKEPAK